MRKAISTWSRLGAAALMLASSSAAFAANNIAVPNGLSGQCGAGNANAQRFAGNCGALVTIDDATLTSAYVQENNPSAETAYRVRLYSNLLRLNMANGDEFDLFAAYDGADPVPPATNGDAAIRVEIQQNTATGTPKQVVIAVRLDNDTEATTSAVTLGHGWNSIEFSWVRSTGPGNNNGTLSWWVNGHPQTGLSTLDNDTEAANYARWGAVAGLDLGTQGTFNLDDYASQRTGYIGPAVPFADVPTSSGFWTYIQGLYQAEITGGCAIGSYCPLNNVTRAQMAVFLEKGMNGALFTPPACVTPTFGDVPCSNPFAIWINQLAADGITGGCGGGNYCPGNNVTREQMAIFLLRSRHGSGYTPPPCVTPTFGDVPCSSGFAAWINQLAAEGITGGCGGGNYCPTNPVTREQMAIFLGRTFDGETFEWPIPDVGP
jgi:hypothetical protein